MARIKGSEKRKRRRENEEEEEQSKRKRIDSGSYVLEVLFNHNSSKFNLFEEVNSGRKIIPGKAVDFTLFGDEEKGWTLPSIAHLVNQGWKRFLKIKEPTYTRLVQVLITNFNPSSRRSWIGECEIDLSSSSLREIFDIPEVQEFQDFPSKGEVFSELGNGAYTDATKHLPTKDLSVDLKIAHTILVHCVCPRIGSLDQVPIKEARTLWALKKGHKLDRAKIISDQLVYAKHNDRSPIPYGMFLTKVLKHFQINLKDEPSIPFRKSEVISKSTIKRMGYIYTPQGWVPKGKGTSETAQAEGPQEHISEQPEQRIEEVTAEAGEGEVREETFEEVVEIAREVEEEIIREEVGEAMEEEEEEEMREAALGILGIREEEFTLPREAEVPTASPTPHIPSPSIYRSPPRPSTHSPPTPQPSLILSELQLYITQSLTDLEAKLNLRIDNLENSLTTKLENIHSLLQIHHPHTQIQTAQPVIHSPVTSHHTNHSHHSPQIPSKSPSPPAKSPQPVTPIPSPPPALPTPLSPPVPQPVQSPSPPQPSPPPTQPDPQPISPPKQVQETTSTTSPTPPKPSPLRIPKYKPTSKPKSLTPFPQILPESSSELSSPPTLQSTRPSAPPKSKAKQSQSAPDLDIILMESNVYTEMIEANTQAHKQQKDLPYPEMEDPAVLARIRTIPSQPEPSTKQTKPSTSRPSSSKQPKPRQPSKPRVPKPPTKPRQPPKPRQPKLPKPPTKPSQPRPRQPKTQPQPTLQDQPTVATSSDLITARPLLAFRHPPPPEVPVLASQPSPSSSTLSPTNNLIYMEDEEYSARKNANKEALQKCTLQIQLTGKYAIPEYPFPELNDPSYTSRIVLKPTIHDVQPISVQPPQPANPTPSQTFLPPRPLPPSRPLPPPKPVPALTYRKKSVHKPSSSSKPPPS